MPISYIQYRIITGTYNSQCVLNQEKYLNFNYLAFIFTSCLPPILTFSLLACIQLLLLMSGIESNPGPNDKRNKGSTASIKDLFTPSRNLQRTPEKENTNSTSTKRQREETPPSTPEASVNPSGIHGNCELYFLEIKNLIVQNTSCVNELRNKFEILENKLSQVSNDISNLKSENSFLRKTNEEIVQAVSELQGELDRQENYSRKNNLIFHGLPVLRTDSEETCEIKMKDFVRNNLGFVDVENIIVDIAHVLPSRGNMGPPVMVKFAKRTDRNNILEAFRKGRKETENLQSFPNQSLSIRVNEDFSKRVRVIRSKLIPIMKSSINEGKTVKLRSDKLCIDNQWITYDLSNNKIVNICPFKNVFMKDSIDLPNNSVK